MKRILMIFALLAVFSGAVLCAQESSDSSSEDDSKWSSLSYVNVPIMKILEGKEAYVVIYQKNKTGAGNVVIPKKWVKGSNEEPRKLKFRAVKTQNQAFMTVVKNDGEFLRVILSVPMLKTNPIWGMADYHKEIEGADKDTLEELEF